jgi:hypothetical protein
VRRESSPPPLTAPFTGRFTGAPTPPVAFVKGCVYNAETMSTETIREYASQILRTPGLTVRQSMAVEALGRGATLQEIGDHAGFTRERARQVAQSALERFKEWANGGRVVAEMETEPAVFEIGRRPRPREGCSEEGCKGRYHALGLCERHYHRFRYHDSEELRRKHGAIARDYMRRIRQAVSDEEWDGLTYKIGRKRWPKKG